MIRKKTIDLRDAGLGQKDEPKESPRTCKLLPEGHACYKEVCTQEYDTVSKDNGVKQKGKRPAQDDEFVEKLEATVGNSAILQYMHMKILKYLSM